MDKTKVNLERLRACDEWEESKHPRANNGQFTSGAGSSGSKSQVANLTSLKKSGDKATKAAIGILGSDIKSALAAAHSEKGFTAGMLSDAKAATYAKKLSELTGEEFYIDKVTEKGFMGMDFTKPVLKVKPASESPLRKAAKTIQGKGAKSAAPKPKMAKTDEERLKYTSNPEERKAFEKVTGLVEMLPAKMLKEYNAYVEFGNTEHLKKLCSYVRNATGMKIDF